MIRVSSPLGVLPVSTAPTWLDRSLQPKARHGGHFWLPSLCLYQISSADCNANTYAWRSRIVRKRSGREGLGHCLPAVRTIGKVKPGFTWPGCPGRACVHTRRSVFGNRTLAKLMGHADVSVTMEFYNRVTDANEREAGRTMDALLGTRDASQKVLNVG